MDRRFLWVFVAVLLVPLVSGDLQVRLQPNASATSAEYYYSNVNSLSSYFTYTDALVSQLQDWYGNITYEGVKQVGLPKSDYRWTFDYDNLSTAIDQSLADANADGLRSMYATAYIYLNFEEEVNGWYTDWANYKGNNNISFTGGSRRVPTATGMGMQTNGLGAAGAYNDDYENFTILANTSYLISVELKAHDTSSHDIVIFDDGFGDFTWFAEDPPDRHQWVYQLDNWDGSPCRLYYYMNESEVNQTWVHSLYHNSATGYLGIQLNGTLYNSTTCNGNKADSFTEFFSYHPFFHNNVTFDNFWMSYTTRYDIDDTLANYSCHAGNCLLFDGVADSINIPNHEYDLRNATFAFWAEPARNDIPASEFTLLGNSGTDTKSFLTFGSTETLELESDTNGNIASGTMHTDVSDGFHHYVVTCNNYHCTFYQDAINITDSTSSIMTDNVTFTHIGKRSSTGYYEGVLDDFTIWNVSLTPEQVQYHYNQSLTHSIVGDVNGTYTFNMHYRDNVTVGITSNLTNLTVSRLNISFYDEDTGAIITDEVNITLTGSTESYFGTTTTGSVYIELFADNYNLEFSGLPTYSVRYSTLTAAQSTETQQFNLYLSNTTVKVFATVYDEALQTLEGAIIYVYRNVDGVWTLSETSTTNFAGLSLLNLILDTELYRFNIEYGGVMVYESAPTLVYNTEITFQVVIGEEAFTEFFSEEGIIADVSFDVTNDRFIYNYANSNGGTVQACLRTYRVRADADIEVNETCSTSDSAIIYHPVTATNGTTYRGEGWLDWGYGDEMLDSKYYTYADWLPQKQHAILYQALGTAVVALTSFWSLALGVIGTPASLIIGRFMGLHELNWGILIGLQLISIIVVIMLRRVS